MAISRLTPQDATASVTSTTVTATYASTPVLGDLLIATCFTNAGIFSLSMTSPGWTNACFNLDGSGTNLLYSWYKIAGSGESTSVTCTNSSGSFTMQLHIYEYGGTNTTNQLPDFSAVTGTTAASGTSLLSNSLATVNNNDLLFVATAWSAGVTSPSFDSGFNTLHTTTRIITADNIVSSAGTYSTTCSWTTSRISLSNLLAFTQAPSDYKGIPITTLVRTEGSHSLLKGFG